MIRSFKGITALVTGASSGIGKAMARILASEGANLVLAARNLPRLEQEAADLKGRYSVNVQVFAGDLSQPEIPRKLFEFTRERGLDIDLLVNNAGIGHCGLFEATGSQDIRAMLNLNIEALTVLTHLFLPGMLARKKGGVLNVASTAAFQPIPYLSIYAASKAFVVHFSEALWSECKGRGVRVFCLCPGNTLTRFHQTAGIARSRMFFSASAGDVARFALRKFLRSGSPTAIYGFWNKVMYYAARLSPRRLTVFMTNLMYCSWGRKKG